MLLSHMGVAIAVIGIAVSTGFGIQNDVEMAPGDRTELAGYHLSFVSERNLSGPNYHGAEAVFRIEKQGKSKTIYPQKRIYNVGQMPMTESAIDVNPFRDIYVALGEPMGDKGWSVRLYYKPFVRWIWGGGFFIFAGGLLALSDPRYFRRRRKTTAEVQEAAA